MSVSKVKTRVVFVALIAMAVVLGGATLASACDADGNGRSGGFGCPKEPPSYPDKEKGDPDPRDNPLTEEQLWARHCSPRWDNEDPEDNNFWYDVRELDPEFNEYRGLDPTGEYTEVWAVCDGPRWRRAQSADFGYYQAGFDRWFIAETEPVPLQEIRDEGLPAIEEKVAARLVRSGEMAPPADANVVRTKTWLWVENDFDDTVRAEAERGFVTVWVEAVPTNTVFEVDGEEIARCEGPGTPYEGGLLDAETDCSYEGFEQPSSGAPLDGTVTIEWVFHWGMGDDYYGEFHTYDATTDLAWTVDEVFSTETG